MIYVNDVDMNSKLASVRIDREAGLTIYFEGWHENSRGIFLETGDRNDIQLTLVVSYNKDTMTLNRVSLDTASASNFDSGRHGEMQFDLSDVKACVPVLDIVRLRKDPFTGNINQPFTYHICQPNIVYCREYISLQLIDSPIVDHYIGLNQVAFEITKDQAISNIIIHSLTEEQYIDFDAWCQIQRDRHD